MTVIQAILLSKEFYDKNQAEAYIKRHKYKPIKKSSYYNTILPISYQRA